MNSEELEQSLRTEFESYLKTVLAEIRQESTGFQKQIEAEVDKHKAQLDNAFKAYTTRFDSEHTFDEAFRGSVAEHLRLARDEGARITADAMDAAEKLNGPVAPVKIKYDAVRDAVSDISSKDSQSAILKSLVQHAAEFATRGAFFIIKNEHFVGWKVFGTDDEKAENAIREIHFPTANDSILGASLKTQSTVAASAGDHSNDSLFLDPLHFDQPANMYAIPLVARGRGVAVLYADHGQDGPGINIEAIETLVRVAGLTVELLAASQTAKAENRTIASADFEDAQHESDTGFTTPVASQFEHKLNNAPVAVIDAEPESFPYSKIIPHPVLPVEQPTQAFDAPKFEPTQFEASQFEEPQFEVSHFETAPVVVPDTFANENKFTDEPVVSRENLPVASPSFTDYAQVQKSPFETDSSQSFETAKPEAEDMAGALVFDPVGSVEPAKAGSPFDQAVERYVPVAVVGGGYSPVMESVIPVIEAPVMTAPKARLSDRPVDLPIEVPEDERRIHNDARRFARLLVSEIKLYNEKKVIEGREGNDLYDRLREAIDRSREMYDKRVQPPVAAKFDYFHYEIVNSLADGNADRLGSGYPGATV